MKFTKMHGAGNDYIYIDCFKENVENPERLSKKLSDRHFGVGADGIVLIKPSYIADCFMDIYNADGSRAQMCGNAIRCVAKYIYDNRKKKPIIKIDTLSGIKLVEIFDKNGIATGGRVNMGKPILNGHSIPTRYGDNIVKNQILNIENNDYEITCVSMGNPHCVVFTDYVDGVDVKRIGPMFENAREFPERINTEFIRVVNPTTIKMRVYERGNGETLGCGTGACAAVVAAVENGICKMGEDITVKLRGGDLIVNYTEDGVTLTGNADLIYQGYFKD